MLALLAAAVGLGLTPGQRFLYVPDVEQVLIPPSDEPPPEKELIYLPSPAIRFLNGKVVPLEKLMLRQLNLVNISEGKLLFELEGSSERVALPEKVAANGPDYIPHLAPLVVTDELISLRKKLLGKSLPMRWRNFYHCVDCEGSWLGYWHSRKTRVR